MTTASYQTFIQTLSNSQVFNLRSRDNNRPGRYVRSVKRLIGGIERDTLILDNNAQNTPIRFILRAIINSDNFQLLNISEDDKIFPIIIVSDVNKKFFIIDKLADNPPILINPAAINQPGIIVKFAAFTIINPSIGIQIRVIDSGSDEKFLTVDTSFPIVEFGFEMKTLIMSNANINQIISIRSFTLNLDSIEIEKLIREISTFIFNTQTAIVMINLSVKIINSVELISI